MTSQIKKTQFEEILIQLVNARDWLENINVKTDNSRFLEVFEYVEIICDHHSKNKVQELLDNYEDEILWWALLESNAFIDIFKAFNKLKNHELPRRKLAESLTGPFLSKDEDAAAQNIHSRNTLFELQIAAKFQNAGIGVIGFDDIGFVLDGYEFNAQCKRIHSLKRIEDNVLKAYDQMKSKFDENEKLKGIICLSINKLEEKDDKILRVKKPADVGHEMIRITSEFIESHRSCWQKIIDIRVIATLVHFQAAAIIEEINLLTQCNQIEIDPIAIPENLQSREFELIKEISSTIQASS